MTSKASSCCIILLFFEMSYQAIIQTPELLKVNGLIFSLIVKLRKNEGLGRIKDPARKRNKVKSKRSNIS